MARASEQCVQECSQCMGSNVTDHSVQRIWYCVGRMPIILQQYDQEKDVHEESGYHTERFTGVDFDKLMKQLQDTNVSESTLDTTIKTFLGSASALKPWMQKQMRT